MNTIKIESETSDTLTINYKGALIEVDQDTDELLIDKKLYKIPALRRKFHKPVPKPVLLLPAPADTSVKFICSAKILYKAVNAVCKVVSKRPALDILGNVVLRLEKGSLTISASNLKKHLTEVIEVESNCVGQIAVPAFTLRDLLYYFPDQPLHFKMVTEIHDFHFHVISETGSFKMGAYDADEFPIIPTTTNI